MWDFFLVFFWLFWWFVCFEVFEVNVWVLILLLLKKFLGYLKLNLKFELLRKDWFEMGFLKVFGWKKFEFCFLFFFFDEFFLVEKLWKVLMVWNVILKILLNEVELKNFLKIFFGLWKKFDGKVLKDVVLCLFGCLLFGESFFFLYLLYILCLFLLDNILYVFDIILNFFFVCFLLFGFLLGCYFNVCFW